MSATASIAPGSGPQYMQALARANEVRLARAGLKRRVASGEITVPEILLGTHWEAENMTISDLLMSQRRWGHTRCRKLLMQVPVSENKAVGKMTERQRRALLKRRPGILSWRALFEADRGRLQRDAS